MKQLSQMVAFFNSDQLVTALINCGMFIFIMRQIQVGGGKAMSLENRELVWLKIKIA